jgi:hypothetical protein
MILCYLHTGVLLNFIYSEPGWGFWVDEHITIYCLYSSTIAMVCTPTILWTTDSAFLAACARTQFYNAYHSLDQSVTNSEQVC